MHRPDTPPREADLDRETLAQQVRALQERLAFYEGFDRLIQDNVAHARELFRLAAQEREAAAIRHIVCLPPTGGRQAFTSGTGDVLISYENEAIAAKQNGADVDYVIPDTSIKIENPGAVTVKASESAKKFLTFVTSDNGQKIFAEHGFRPLNSSVKPDKVEGANDPANPFPTVQKLVTINDLGGWSEVSKKFFDEESGIVTQIQDASGVS